MELWVFLFLCDSSWDESIYVFLRVLGPKPWNVVHQCQTAEIPAREVKFSTAIANHLRISVRQMTRLRRPCVSFYLHFPAATAMAAKEVSNPSSGNIPKFHAIPLDCSSSISMVSSSPRHPISKKTSLSGENSLSGLMTEREYPTSILNLLRYLRSNRQISQAFQIISYWNQIGGRSTEECYVQLIHFLGEKGMPFEAQILMQMMGADNIVPTYATLSALMLCFAVNGLSSEAQSNWNEIINSSFQLNLDTFSKLVEAYARAGSFPEIERMLCEAVSRYPKLSRELYVTAIHCFGKGGRLETMEKTIKEMTSKGFKVDSVTANAYVLYYSMFGSSQEMETAYHRLKRSKILIEKDAIRAMALVYIRQRKFYQLAEYLRDVGLGRRNSGNLLWNLLLLSYAANFKMKSLQRTFLQMLEAGFSPDLTTFNIRSLAFSRMCMFWDLHLSIDHMRHENVTPDLVTYGCFVDMYVHRRLAKNLSFALEKIDVKSSPLALTDPLVYEVLGKGDFHLFSDTLLDARPDRDWTYSKLISIYLQKVYRSNQIFWNY